MSPRRQQRIVTRIGETLGVALTDIESARSKRERPTNPDAFDLIIRARSLSLHTMGASDHVEALGSGGYGPPASRDEAALAADLADGYVTHAAARDDYGSAP